MLSPRSPNLFVILSLFHYIASLNVSIPQNPVLKHLVSLLYSPEYDKTLRPLTDEHPINVSLRVTLLDVTGVSQSEGYFLADLVVTQVWWDPQLSYDQIPNRYLNISLQPDLADRVWTPNICFVNSKAARMHFSPDANIVLQVMPNGTVYLQYRVQAQGPCDIDLSKFPMDVQGCTLIFESYSYNIDDVTLEWAGSWERQMSLLLLSDGDRYKIPDFTLSDLKLSKAQLQYTAGTWDQLVMRLTFTRKMGFYILQAYLPTYVCVAVSWVSFYLDTSATAARAALGVNTLMALILNFGNIISDLPRVSYMRAIDIWMFGCMLLTFGTLVEYALVGFIERNRLRTARKGKLERRMRLEEANENLANAGGIEGGQQVEESAVRRRRQYHVMADVSTNGSVRYVLKKIEFSRAGRVSSVSSIDTDMIGGLRGTDVDAVCAKLFPLAFVGFNIWYWVYFLN